MFSVGFVGSSHLQGESYIEVLSVLTNPRSFERYGVGGQIGAVGKRNNRDGNDASRIDVRSALVVIIQHAINAIGLGQRLVGRARRKPKGVALIGYGKSQRGIGSRVGFGEVSFQVRIGTVARFVAVGFACRKGCQHREHKHESHAYRQACEARYGVAWVHKAERWFIKGLAYISSMRCLKKASSFCGSAILAI